MSATQVVSHTPGPWYVEDDYCISAAGGTAIGSVNTSDDFPCIDEGDTEQCDAEARANALLMAAAPEMYANDRERGDHVKRRR